jgi:hypothetical protein
VPINPRAWLNILRTSSDSGFRDPLELALSALQNALRMTGRMVTSPLENIDWGLEVLEKSLGLAACYANQGLRTLARPQYEPSFSDSKQEEYLWPV